MIEFAGRAFVAVLFDGDGVVFDSEELSILAFCESLRPYGIHLDRAGAERFIGVGTGRVLETLIAENNVRIDMEKFVDDRDEFYMKVSREHDGPKAAEGAVALLDFLDAKGIPFALASSASPAKVKFNLETSGLTGRFRAVVNGAEVARGKPDPDIFQEAARRLGVAPQDCLALEDSLHGLTSAITAGCTAIAIASSFPAAALREYTQHVYANPGGVLRVLKG